MRSIILLSILMMACSQQRDRIAIPKVDQTFYTQALLQIEEDLKSDDDNLKLIEQKIYYCDYLGWPSTCITALDEFKKQKGMSPVLLDQYITYYKKHDEYEPLLEIIERWSDELNLGNNYIRERIIGYIKSNKSDQAKALLRGYMINKNAKEDVLFAAEQYLIVRDTIMSSYYLGRLALLDSNNELIYSQYPYILLNLGYTEQAFNLFEKYASINSDDLLFHSELATFYEQEQRFFDSRKKLMNFIDQDSIVYRVADLYLAEEKWDSAHVMVDKIIERDSANREAWWKKATMYEAQGWLTYSMNYYDHILYLYPKDTVAVKRAALVRQKIAYLQRLKFEENKTPLLELESKKTIN